MIRTCVRVGVAVGLIGLGWMTAKAQTAQPAFELVVSAPVGETTIECVRGCELGWVERGLNPNSTAQPTFTFKCGGSPDSQCSSYKVGGWLKP